MMRERLGRFGQECTRNYTLYWCSSVVLIIALADKVAAFSVSWFAIY